MPLAGSGERAECWRLNGRVRPKETLRSLGGTDQAAACALLRTERGLDRVAGGRRFLAASGVLAPILRPQLRKPKGGGLHHSGEQNQGRRHS